jgi:hypothetical protein
MIAESRARVTALAAMSRLRGAIGRRSTPRDRAFVSGGVSRTDLAIVAVLIAVATSVYSHYALRIGSFQNDEEAYLQIVRYISHHLPSALWQNEIANRQTMLFARGLQRLDLFILAVPFWKLRGPGAFQLAHVIQCLLFASTALPAFLMARRAHLTRSASLLAATLVLVVPWAVVSTSFLEESAAYPAYAWVLYTTWMAACQPSARREILAVLALAVAALSRTAMLALAPILPLAILWHEWRWELASKRLCQRARALPGQLWSRHRVVSVLVGLLILIFISGQTGLLAGHGASGLTGSYGLPHLEPLSTLLPRYRYYASRMAAGTGFLALALGLPWTVGTLIRPRDGGSHAIAVVCTLGVAGVLLSLLGAGFDERYVLYTAVPISLALAMALTSWVRTGGIRLGTALSLVGGALAVALLIDSVSWPALGSPYDFFTYPAAIFYQRVLLGRASLVHIPLVHLLPAGRLVEVAIVIVTAAWALAARSARAVRPAAGLLGIGLIVVCGIQLIYNLRKYTEGAGEGNGPDAAQRSWVDRHVPDGAGVGTLAISLGETLGYQPVWRVVDYWNTSIDASVYFNVPPSSGALPFPLSNEPVQLTIEPGSGLVSTGNGLQPGRPQSIPDYVLVSHDGTRRVGLEGKVVGQDPALPLELIHLSRPVRVDWSLAGTTAEGFMASGAPATATIYSGALAGAGRHCATFSLIAPPGFSGRWPYTVTSGGRQARRGTLIAAQATTVSVPLHPRTGRYGSTATLTVRVHGQVTVNTSQLSATIASFSVGPCPTAKTSRQAPVRRQAAA